MFDPKGFTFPPLALSVASRIDPSREDICRTYKRVLLSCCYLCNCLFLGMEACSLSRVPRQARFELPHNQFAVLKPIHLEPNSKRAEHSHEEYASSRVLPRLYFQSIAGEA